jgi:hypothetical protein
MELVKLKLFTFLFDVLNELLVNSFNEGAVRVVKHVVKILFEPLEKLFVSLI